MVMEASIASLYIYNLNKDTQALNLGLKHVKRWHTGTDSKDNLLNIVKRLWKYRRVSFSLLAKASVRLGKIDTLKDKYK